MTSLAPLVQAALACWRTPQPPPAPQSVTWQSNCPACGQPATWVQHRYPWHSELTITGCPCPPCAWRIGSPNVSLTT